jgi:hypothetical protein
LFEGGSVLLPTTRGRHDDQVDALTQGLAWWRGMEATARSANDTRDLINMKEAPSAFPDRLRQFSFKHLKMFSLLSP